MSAPSTETIRELRAALDDVSVMDAHRLRRRLDELGSGRSRRGKKRSSTAGGGQDRGRDDLEAALARMETDITEARRRVDRRRASVPVLTFPEDLPVSAARDEIAAAIADHQVVVIAGETGSGKTTQLPKICLELGRGIRGAIGHTQPRRIAASSVARRIADETGTEIGDAIGFSVRFTDRAGADTLVKVMTDGILLREITSDPLLRRYDTLIIDEAHERSLNIDFILGYLRQLLPKRPDLKVIVTSATIEPDRFARHFSSADSSVPILEVSGRTYPVEVRYRPLVAPSDDTEHTDLDQIQGIDAAITELWAHDRGDILVFLPTERDIRETADALQRRTSTGAEIVPLYARLSVADQQRVFAPSDGRRIVLATNVAETSLTVPGIRYVIDTGTARISRYSTRTKVTRLPVEPVSQASARQRAGRCGRVAPGICIRLYGEDDFDARPGFTDPEILRTNLAAVILQMASLRLGDIAEFPFVQPPDDRAIRDGMGVLTELGAITATPARDGSPVLTPVGRTMARLPVDPRLARMLTAAHESGCLDHLLVIAAALSVPDVRERPSEHREAADAAHRRFAVPGSEFLGHLALWEYLNEQRQQLSGNQFRRQCGREFLHYLRIREWQDLHRQLRRVVADLDWSTTPTERDPDAIHRAILSGLLGNIAARRTDSREFTGARNTTVVVFPGSPLAKKPPPFIMAAELIETSRLFAHTVAGIDPLWAEKLAGDLVKRTYSEPHWSSKRGAAMAYERVTLYGVTLVAKRRITYGSIDPETSRELFIRHALVEGDWTTSHAFFARNRDLLDEAQDVEHRARRRDLTISEDQLYAFYDERVGAEVVSARHFDSWWKKARRERPDLLDLRREDVQADAPVADTDFPGAWRQGETTVDLVYRFEPGASDDGVSVLIPEPLLPHVRTAGFDWSVPGLRSELATELIRTLPKSIRKSLAPAQRFADLALSRLKPRSEPLVSGLARELSAITGMTITPDDFSIARVPDHLRMNFAVVDRSGDVVSRSKSLRDLQKAAGSGTAPRSRPVHRSWTDDGIGTLAESVTQTVSGQQLTRFPALEPTRGADGTITGVSPVLASTAEHRDRLVADAVVALLDLGLPLLGKKIVATLDPASQIAFSQSPYADAERLTADCTRRAVRDLLPSTRAASIRTPQQFTALVDALRPEVATAAPDYFVAAVDVLRRLAPLRAEIDRHAGSAAADDVAEQLDHLVFDGFVLATPYRQLTEVPRYLEAAESRLEQLPGSAARDRDGLAAVDRVIARWAQRMEQLPESRRDQFNERAHWMVEELRVGLFAQRLRTAYPVSEKRALRALDRGLDGPV
ncbi:ATP-dependent RNA helicase HrpA [Gordonia soli]|uniref:ATP-dependent RNA helicase HrpA n=1 Tax=Gordonia soli NBRC 108243 TaxID=1223545 RepID=M0QK57_9ACTN|nr:ATP-dependent RNA helicase HrpA [Gordonia soli]GAC68923.1 ATP-dependent RNA helicase HrpA [Gordonia soli NBRC 108243]